MFSILKIFTGHVSRAEFYSVCPSAPLSLREGREAEKEEAEDYNRVEFTVCCLPVWSCFGSLPLNSCFAHTTVISE